MQLFPLYLTPALLKQVNNNFTVVEVWHRTPGTNTDDEVWLNYEIMLYVCLLSFILPPPLIYSYLVSLSFLFTNFTSLSPMRILSSSVLKPRYINPLFCINNLYIFKRWSPAPCGSSGLLLSHCQPILWSDNWSSSRADGSRNKHSGILEFLFLAIAKKWRVWSVHSIITYNESNCM